MSVLYHHTVFSGSDVNGDFKSLGTNGFGLDFGFNTVVFAVRS